jgi:hypothetical protein
MIILCPPKPIQSYASSLRAFVVCCIVSSSSALVCDPVNPLSIQCRKERPAEVLYVPHHFQVLSNNTYFPKEEAYHGMIAFAIGVERTPAHNAIQQSKSQSTLDLI